MSLIRSTSTPPTAGRPATPRLPSAARRRAWGGSWSLGATPMLTRFDVVSDANGEISGTFTAADENGGAFNGLTLVGELPVYKSQATVITIR